jgi:hypothetical protein
MVALKPLPPLSRGPEIQRLGSFGLNRGLRTGFVLWTLHFVLPFRLWQNGEGGIRYAHGLPTLSSSRRGVLRTPDATNPDLLKSIGEGGIRYASGLPTLSSGRRGVLRTPDATNPDLLKSIGEGGIRTHGTLTSTHALQACPFVHSGTSPQKGNKR